MSLKYGLNVKKAGPVRARRTIFSDEDEDEENDFIGKVPSPTVEEIGTVGGNSILGSSPPAEKLTSRPLPPSKRRKEQEDRYDLSSAGASRAHVKAAEELDPSIFDYDSFHDAKTSITEAKKAATRQDAIERKPKYINNLLDAAARRKQDQLLAREKLLQKEREAEGDEFADKEKFVTGAYKQQQEETRMLEEEEKKKVEEEEKRKRAVGGGMQGFYRGMMDRQERQHQEAMEATTKIEQDGNLKTVEGKAEKGDAELAAEMKAKGVSVHLNDEGQVVDKRELLSAGLNITPSANSRAGGGADHLKVSTRPAHSAFQKRNDASRQAQRERQSRMIEEQLATQTKRVHEEEIEETLRVEKAAKSSKTEKDVSDAKARYLARKAAKERSEG